MKEENRLLNENEAATILGLAVQTLRNRRCAKRPPPYVKLGAAVRYKLEDLESLIEKNRIDPEAE
jgi:predicted DNA-binding transcriptional regulator AlpA